jgi:hypothetical protein
VELIVAFTARWQSKVHLGDMQRAMFKSFDRMEFGSQPGPSGRMQISFETKSRGLCCMRPPAQV